MSHKQNLVLPQGRTMFDQNLKSCHWGSGEWEWEWISHQICCVQFLIYLTQNRRDSESSMLISILVWRNVWSRFSIYSCSTEKMWNYGKSTLQDPFPHLSILSRATSLRAPSFRWREDISGGLIGVDFQQCKRSLQPLWDYISFVTPITHDLRVSSRL